MKNEQIKSYLTNRRNEYENDINAISDREAIFDEVYSELTAFDFEGYKRKLEEEIRYNLKEYWTNPEKGIIKEEELFAILFEYDNVYAKDVEAPSFGIGKWNNFEVQTEEFDMGWDYDFATKFYAAPGITLNFFDPLEKLDGSNLPEKYLEEEIYDFEGFFELTQLFKFNGMIAIHDVLKKMDVNLEFEVLNYKNNFMFIIDEHDSGDVYPLLIKEKK